MRPGAHHKKTIVLLAIIIVLLLVTILLQSFTYKRTINSINASFEGKFVDLCGSLYCFDSSIEYDSPLREKCKVLAYDMYSIFPYTSYSKNESMQSIAKYLFIWCRDETLDEHMYSLLQKHLIDLFPQFDELSIKTIWEEMEKSLILINGKNY